MFFLQYYIQQGLCGLYAEYCSFRGVDELSTNRKGVGWKLIGSLKSYKIRYKVQGIVDLSQKLFKAFLKSFLPNTVGIPGMS